MIDCGCYDIKLSKRKLIKLCKKLNINIDMEPFTNINGGKYIRIFDDSWTKRYDIYYKCFINTRKYITPTNHAKSKEEFIEILKEIR